MLSRPIAAIAGLYDMQHDPRWADDLTRVTQAGPVGTAFVPPRSLGDLVARRQAYQVWADASFWLLGRSPDFLNTTLMALAAEPAVFSELGQRYARTTSSATTRSSGTRICS